VVVEDERGVAMRGLELVCCSVHKGRHLEVDVVFTGIGLGHELVNGRDRLTVELPGREI
jgi:hypothetical protein